MEYLADVFKKSDKGQKILSTYEGSSTKKIKGLKHKIRLKNYRRPKGADKPKLLKLFRLCFLNGFNDSRKVLDDVALIYGQLFYKHYELKQRIRDSLENGKNDYREIKTIQPNLEQILHNEFRLFFKSRCPVFPKGLSINSAKEHNLADLDKKYNFPTYSYFLKSLLPNKINSNTNIEYLYNFRPDKDRFKKEWLPRIQKAYFLGILNSIIVEIKRDENIYGRYQPHFNVEKPAEAVNDFFERNGLTNYSDHSDSQIAHLIKLRYRTNTDGELKPDSLRKAVNRYRS